MNKTQTQKEIMILLKDNFEKVVGKKKPFQCGSEARNYYLCNLKDNLIEPMSDKTLLEYGHGKGNEIFSGKMNALRSSSALTYNIFGNHPVKIDKKVEKSQIGEGLYEVEFEKQFPTLKPSVSKMPANLDAFLINKEKEEAIAVEMKMLEWVFNEPKKLKDAYLKAENYCCKEEDGEKFVEVARKLIDADKKGLFNRYDAFQMFKHAVACYNACCSGKITGIKKLTLLNCVWTLPDKYQEKNDKEKAEFEVFYNIVNKDIAELFAGFNPKIKFAIEFVTVKDFISRLEKTPKELNYLKRYTF